MIKVGILFTFIFSFAAFAGKFTVKSNPEGAEIYITSDANEKAEKIGKTPFNQDIGELIQTYVKKNTFIIELRKEGFETYRVLFAKTTNIDVDLSVNMKVSKAIRAIKKHDLLMNQLFDVQKLIRGRNFLDALTKLEELEELEELEKEYEHFSIITELKATTCYMMKDVEKALSHYRRAFAKNSDNIEAYKMKVYLEKKMGIDTEGGN